uniref:Aldo_ket_red domain-containing protein n=1 Tax=Syphacia muris TaxID=451379 RepID=A0A0N5ACG7_9BILA
LICIYFSIGCNIFCAVFLFFIDFFSKTVQFKRTPCPLEDAFVKKLAEKYHKTRAQILIRHLLQRGLSQIPKSVNEKHIKENLDIFDFELDAGDFKQLNSLKNECRMVFWDFLKGHPEDPFKDERN